MARSKYREVPIVPLSCFSVRSWSNSEIWILGRLGPKSLDPNGEDWWYSTEWGHALCRYYMDVIWILYGYYMDIIWIWYAYYMDVIWILYAYYMDVIWILYAYYMDIICFCIVKNVMAQVPPISSRRNRQVAAASSHDLVPPADRLPSLSKSPVSNFHVEISMIYLV